MSFHRAVAAAETVFIVWATIISAIARAILLINSRITRRVCTTLMAGPKILTEILMPRVVASTTVGTRTLTKIATTTTVDITRIVTFAFTRWTVKRYLQILFLRQEKSVHKYLPAIERFDLGQSIDRSKHEQNVCLCKLIISTYLARREFTSMVAYVATGMCWQGEVLNGL